jgi:hypothetical protein
MSIYSENLNPFSFSYELLLHYLLLHHYMSAVALQDFSAPFAYCTFIPVQKNLVGD